MECYNVQLLGVRMGHAPCPICHSKEVLTLTTSQCFASLLVLTLYKCTVISHSLFYLLVHVLYLKARPSCKACSFPIVVSSPPHLTISSSAWSLSTGTFCLSSFVSSLSFDSSLVCVLTSLHVLSFLFASFPCFFFPLFSSDPESPCRLSLLSLSFPSRGLPRYLN